MKPHKAKERHRLERLTGATLRSWDGQDGHPGNTGPRPDSVLDCGWGRLIFAHTFVDPDKVVETLRHEAPGHRDIAFYVKDPHVAVSLAPQDVFLDPSHTFRLWLPDYQPSRRRSAGFIITPLQHKADIREINRIYAHHGMMTVAPDTLWENRRSRKLCYLVARDSEDGSVIGVVMGADHWHVFADPDKGCSLWSLAVDPQTSHPGIGEALVRRLAERYKARGRAFMDLSVMHDNAEAVALYERLGFRRVPVFALKCRNSINERLYAGPRPDSDYNPYARIIIDEARRRGIHVEPLDPPEGYFRLSFGGRSVTCREALSDLTSAVAFSRCDDKVVTRKVLQAAGLSVPAQRDAGAAEENAAFLAEHGAIVVKPAKGEQGQGVAVDLRTADEVEAAVTAARALCDRVVLEQYCSGADLRIIVIGHEVVAAAIRKPATVKGNGKDSIATLIEIQSRRRAKATSGESTIPMDDQTERCVRQAGHALDDVLPDGVELAVRKTANLHTGGTIHDVTQALHPTLARAAVRAAEALEIPVVGLDFLVPSVTGPDYVIIEANERPGLANHEPQPTARKFIDLLFPQTVIGGTGGGGQGGA